MKIALTRYIGPEGAAFERVGLTFRAYGFLPPTPDSTGGEGAYVGNIVNEYQGHLTQNQTLAIIEHGLVSTRADLEREILDQQMRLYSIQELGDTYEQRR